MTNDIRLISPSQLEEWLKQQGEPRFRAGQISEWIWQKQALSFDEMTNLPLLCGKRGKQNSYSGRLKRILCRQAGMVPSSQDSSCMTVI